MLRQNESKANSLFPFIFTFFSAGSAFYIILIFHQHHRVINLQNCGIFMNIYGGFIWNKNFRCFQFINQIEFRDMRANGVVGGKRAGAMHATHCENLRNFVDNSYSCSHRDLFVSKVK